MKHHVPLLIVLFTRFFTSVAFSQDTALDVEEGAVVVWNDPIHTSFKVVQVLNENEALFSFTIDYWVRSARDNSGMLDTTGLSGEFRTTDPIIFWFEGDTKDLTDGKRVEFTDFPPVKRIGTKQYESVGGGSNTIHHVKPMTDDDFLKMGAVELSGKGIPKTWVIIKDVSSNQFVGHNVLRGVDAEVKLSILDKESKKIVRQWKKDQDQEDKSKNAKE